MSYSVEKRKEGLRGGTGRWEIMLGKKEQGGPSTTAPTSKTCKSLGRAKGEYLSRFSGGEKRGGEGPLGGHVRRVDKMAEKRKLTYKFFKARVGRTSNSASGVHLVRPVGDGGNERLL